MLSVGRVSRTRERFFVFSRTVHAPLFAVIYASRARREAELRATAWRAELTKRRIGEERTLVVRLEPA